MSDSSLCVADPWSTNAFKTLPGNQVHDYIYAESQRSESVDLPQYLDIDDFLASVQKEAGVPVTSKFGAQFDNDVPSLAANEIAPQDLHLAPWIADDRFYLQQASPVCISGPPANFILPTPGRCLHSSEGFPKHRAISSLKKGPRPRKLNHHKAALAARLDGAPKHSSPIAAPCNKHICSAENSRLLPDHDMWSRYLSPEGIVDLFVPDWKMWEPYFPPAIILSLFSSESKNGAKPQMVDCDRSTPEPSDILERQLQLDADGLEILDDKQAKRVKHSDTSRQLRHPQIQRPQAVINAPYNMGDLFPVSYPLDELNANQPISDTDSTDILRQLFPDLI